MISPDDASEIFESHRSWLLGLAYRMLGSVVEAEDVVQETYLRWVSVDHESIQEPRAWLTTTCSRLSIDTLRSARFKRERYVGPWLPEPWLEGDTQHDLPGDQLELDETVSFALLIVLEALEPAQRAAFLLHDVFGISFDEISHILGKTPPACRKLASRARARVRLQPRRRPADAEQYRHLIDLFFRAARQGDYQSLAAMLREDAELTSDGGGKARASRTIIHGRASVARFLAGVLNESRSSSDGTTTQNARFNGAPGLLVFENDQLVTAFAIELDGKLISSVYAIRNPDKLHRLRQA